MSGIPHSRYCRCDPETVEATVRSTLGLFEGHTPAEEAMEGFRVAMLADAFDGVCGWCGKPIRIREAKR
jgi:hypothetical protein